MNKPESPYHKYFRLWLISVTVITVVYVMCCIIGMDNMTISELTPETRQVLSSLTPSHPPPLIHFMDRNEMLSNM